MGWRDLAAAVDRIAVHSFDHGGILFQKVDAAGDPAGDPLPIPAEFDGAFKEVAVGDGVKATTMQPVAWIHFGDFPNGVRPEDDDRLIVSDGQFAGTYVVASVEANDDGSGAILRLVRRSKP